MFVGGLQPGQILGVDKNIVIIHCCLKLQRRAAEGFTLTSETKLPIFCCPLSWREHEDKQRSVRSGFHESSGTPGTRGWDNLTVVKHWNCLMRICGYFLCCNT